MRSIRAIVITVFAAGLTSLGYARQPAQVAASGLSTWIAGTGYAAGIAQQQDEQKPKETPDAKTDKRDKAAKQPKPADSQKSGDEDRRQDRNAARQDEKEDQNKDRAKQGQRDEGKGGRIPDKDFKAHFGQEHKFSVRQVVTTTTIVPNQTRFTYTGYTFVFVDPWPAGWAMSDDCYIDYVDGAYFFFDVAHPGVRIALTIVA